MAEYSVFAYETSVLFSVWDVSAGTLLRLLYRLSTDTTAIVDEYVTATGDSFEKMYYGLKPSTAYVANVGTVSDAGVTTWIGAQSFTTTAPSLPRPNNWNWYNVIESGYPIHLSAVEWNSFCERINAFRNYKGVTSKIFAPAYSGDRIYASFINDAIDAISEIPSHGTLPPKVTAGVTRIAAYTFNYLSSALNAIT